MKPIKILRKPLHVLVLCGFLSQIFGCGTILYPERKGQKGGRIDVGVAVLDGIGLIFFIIPGVIAFAVDFTTGAIYLPPGQSGISIKVVRVSPVELSKDKINEIVAKEAGIPAALDSSKAEAFAMSKTEDIRTKFKDLKNIGYRVKGLSA